MWYRGAASSIDGRPDLMLEWSGGFNVAIGIALRTVKRLEYFVTGRKVVIYLLEVYIFAAFAFDLF